MYKTNVLRLWGSCLVQKSDLVGSIIGRGAWGVLRYKDAPKVGCVPGADQYRVFSQMSESELFRRKCGGASQVCERSDAHEVVDKVRISKDKRHNRDRTDGEHASPNGIQ